MMKPPPLPPRFAPDAVPAGVEVKFVPLMATRPKIDPDALHVHTNGAGGEGTIEAAYRHIMAAPGQNTLPHYQVDRTHDGKTRACKFLPTNLRGIGSTTVGRTTKDSRGNLIWPTLPLEVRNEIDAHGNVRDRTIVIETADTGYLKDPAISPFDEGQIEVVATIVAFEAITHNFPIIFQPDWYLAGVASHTDPKGFPYTTIHKGKICPGLSKKAQVRNLIIPRAAEIKAAWAGLPPVPQPPPPIPPMPIKELEDSNMWVICKTKNPDGTAGPHLASPRIRGGALHIPTEVPLEYVFAASGGSVFDLGSMKAISLGEWGAAPTRLLKEQALVYLGAEV